MPGGTESVFDASALGGPDHFVARAHEARRKRAFTAVRRTSRSCTSRLLGGPATPRVRVLPGSPREGGATGSRRKTVAPTSRHPERSRRISSRPASTGREKFADRSPFTHRVVALPFGAAEPRGADRPDLPPKASALGNQERSPGKNHPLRGRQQVGAQENVNEKHAIRVSASRRSD